jgi:transposase
MVSMVTMKYEKLDSTMDERLKRHWAACEALALGYGGISIVARATGLSRITIRKGIAEVQGTMPDLAKEIEGRIRRPGAGRPVLARKDETLLQDLGQLLSDNTLGDPMSPLFWTCKSTRTLAAELGKMGHHVSHMTVDRLLHDLKYSLRGNRKTESGKQSEDRDAQFRFINRKVQSFHEAGQPVISVDAKRRKSSGISRIPAQNGDLKEILGPSALTISATRHWAMQFPMAFLTNRTTKAGLAWASIITRLNLRRRRSSVGGKKWGNLHIRTPTRSW